MGGSIRNTLVELEDVSNAYAEAIQANAERGPHTLEQEACAALLAALTVLAQCIPKGDVMTIATALSALVIQTTPDQQEPGGVVAALLRDMEGF